MTPWTEFLVGALSALILWNTDESSPTGEPSLHTSSSLFFMCWLSKLWLKQQSTQHEAPLKSLNGICFTILRRLRSVPCCIFFYHIFFSLNFPYTCLETTFCDHFYPSTLHLEQVTQGNSKTNNHVSTHHLRSIWGDYLAWHACFGLVK